MLLINVCLIPRCFHTEKGKKLWSMDKRASYTDILPESLESNKTGLKSNVDQNIVQV